MIDYGKWIYSKDIAGWFSQRAFDIDTQMNVICLASHRTLTEKLEGLKELYAESGEKSVLDRINIINSLQNRSCEDTPTDACLFQVETFYQGQKEWHTSMVFQTAKKAKDEIKRRVEKSIRENGLEKEDFCGIVQMYRKPDSSKRFLHEEDFVTRYDGEVLFCQYSYDWERDRDNTESLNDGVQAMCFLNSEIAWKIPYPSGTIVEAAKNPFFPHIKGVLVNAIEPDKEGFADARYNQWLICPEHVYTEQTHGINVIQLSNDYLSFPSNVELELPYYKQYISVYTGKLGENEVWLEELSKLIQSDRRFLEIILHDRKPNSMRRKEYEKKRLAYIRGLTERGRKQWGQ